MKNPEELFDFQELISTREECQKSKFVLVGKTAIRLTGDWQTIFRREVAKISPFGLSNTFNKKVNAGEYPQVYSSECALLYKGFTICKDIRDNRVIINSVSPLESRFKLVRVEQGPELLEENL